MQNRNLQTEGLKMKQADVSIVNSPLVGKSANEILKHFNDYNFVDDHGHRLEFCEDFMDLVKLASQNKVD